MAITACFPAALSPAKLTAFQKQIALWFYSTGMAFNKAVHRSFLQALQMLHPGAAVPSAHQLSTTLLDACYRDVKVATLNTDGWTDINGNSVLNYVLECGDESYFLESVYPGTISHDATFLAEDVRRVLKKLTFTTVVAVVTDNTAANKFMWATLQPVYHDVFFHGCIAHVIHLIVKDMVGKLKWLGNLQDDCQKMVKFFKKHQLHWVELRRLQKREGKNALALPADTRWGTIEKCFVSVLESEDILLSLVSRRMFLKAKCKKQKAKRRMVYNVITSSDFVSNLKRAITLLDVLSSTQKAVDCGARPISEVCRLFIEVPKKYKDMKMPSADMSIIKSVFSERFDYVYGDAYGVSYLFDPRYGGEGMDEITRDNVVEYIVRWHGADMEDAVVVELMHYQALLLKNARKLRLVREKRVTVQDFWSGLRKFPLLQNVACRVFATSCSSAAAERNFSTYKLIHYAVHNRFQEGRVEKLVFIFFNLNNTSPEEIEEFNDYEIWRMLAATKSLTTRISFTNTISI